MTTTKTKESPVTKLHKSPTSLPDDARRKLGTALNEALTDGIDLFTQLKVAHWNIKGPQFPALHPLFDQFASELAAFNDEVAERALTLGMLAVGTARHVAQHSRLPDYPQDVTADLEHVALLVDRIGKYLTGMRAVGTLADELGDDRTVDLATTVVQTFEKHAWFLQATLDR